MENSKDNLQLKIETVTPETESEGLPNNQENNHQLQSEVSEEKEKTPLAETPVNEQTEVKSGESKGRQNEGAQPEANNKQEGIAKQQDQDNGKNKDEHGVETIDA